MENKKKYIIYSLIIVALILIVTGTTLAILSDSLSGDENIITTGTISLNYEEDLTGLSINNPTNITDNNAKISDDYFKFSITSRANGFVKVGYYIYLNIDTTSTLPRNAVKVHLSNTSNEEDLVSSEIEKTAPILVSNLIPIDASNLTYNSTSNDVILYQDYFSFNNNDTSQTRYYRFRMWIDENYYNNNEIVITGTEENDTTHQATSTSSYFKIKINVIGVDKEPITIVAS